MHYRVIDFLKWITYKRQIKHFDIKLVKENNINLIIQEVNYLIKSYKPEDERDGMIYRWCWAKP